MTAPPMKSVYSSHVEKIGYDAETRELHVEYRGGKRGIYANVPADVAQQVISAPSIGKALHQSVRAGYEFRYHEEGQDG